jgi:hypothetical protein
MRTEADAQGHKSINFLENMGVDLSVNVHRGMFYPTLTAVTGVRIPLGTPVISSTWGLNALQGVPTPVQLTWREEAQSILRQPPCSR